MFTTEALQEQAVIRALADLDGVYDDWSLHRLKDDSWSVEVWPHGVAPADGNSLSYDGRDLASLLRAACNQGVEAARRAEAAHGRD